MSRSISIFLAPAREPLRNGGVVKTFRCTAKMFGKLFGKKRQPENEDQWSVATAEDDGMPLIFRIRTVSPDLDRALLPHLIAVSWPYQPADGGMPSPADKEQMDLLEDLLTPALEGKREAILTVVATGNGVREWQWYSAAPDSTMQLVNSALTGHPPFPVEFSIQDDPEWKAYSQFEEQRTVAVQHGFYARPSAHLALLVTRAGVGTISRTSDIVRFVQGGVVKTFRQATSEMWDTQIETLKDGRIQRFVISQNNAPLSFADLLSLWQDNAVFRSYYIGLLAESPFAAYRWETPCVTTATLDRDFEFVLLHSDSLARPVDRAIAPCWVICEVQRSVVLIACSRNSKAMHLRLDSSHGTFCQPHRASR